MKRICNNNVRIVFVGPEEESNLGLLARTMKNFGFSELCLVRPKAKPHSDTALRLAMHGRDVLRHAKVVQTMGDALKGTRLVVGTTARKAETSRNIRRSSITPAQLAESQSRVIGKIALLFGRESTGLTNSELEQCDFVVSIRSNPYYPTLNITHAAAIILYELFKTKKVRTIPAATAEEKTWLVKYLQGALRKAGCPEYKVKKATRAFRNILGKAMVSRREAQVLMGVLRKVEITLERLLKP